MSMDAAAKRTELAGIARAIASCRDCGLCQAATNPVPGEGSPDADIVFIGEGPGFYEDKQGRPFVGASGKFLDELLQQIGLDRKSVFITNIVKHRPPDNRDPQPDEIEACKRHLQAQIAAIQPKVIVTLGRHSMQQYFPGESIGRVHGKPRKKDGQIVVPMYHPAAALHQQSLRKVIEADFQKLPGFLSRTLGAAPAPGPDADASAAPAPLPYKPELVPAHLRRDTGPVDSEDAAAQAAAAESQQMRLL